MRYHRLFKNFHPSVLKATEELFAARPWAGTDDQKETKFERWLRRASKAYGIPTPRLEIVPNLERQTGIDQDLDFGVIRLAKFSVTTMFHAFRHYMQASGRVERLDWNTGDPIEMMQCEEDALGWACSLFYRTRPKLFRRAVREGRIMGVDPTDLVRATAHEAELN